MKDQLDVIAILLAGVILAALNGLWGKEKGRADMQREAVVLGYAEYYLTNNSQSFRWLCDSPAVEGVGIVEGCRCLEEE